MPRTWGYIVIIAAVLVGVGSLLLPVPETVEVAKIEAPPPVAPPKQAPPKEREARRPKPPKPEPAPPKPFPMQDTTKTRQMIPPKK